MGRTYCWTISSLKQNLRFCQIPFNHCFSSFLLDKELDDSVHSVQCCEIAHNNDKCDSVTRKRAKSLICPPLLDTRLITLFLATYAYHVRLFRVYISSQTNSKIIYYRQLSCVSCIKNRCKAAHVCKNYRWETRPLPRQIRYFITKVKRFLLPDPKMNAILLFTRDY